MTSHEAQKTIHELEQKEHELLSELSTLTTCIAKTNLRIKGAETLIEEARKATLLQRFQMELQQMETLKKTLLGRVEKVRDAIGWHRRQLRELQVKENSLANGILKHSPFAVLRTSTG